MRLINTGNNTSEKIISSDDIIMLQNNENTGNSLTEVIDNQQEDIDNLKSNVKWLYKYGGVGGRGGSGGSGSSSKYGVVATLDGIKIGQSMIIDKSRYNHQLIIQISKPGGKIYKCQYKIEGAQNYGVLYEINSDNQYKLTLSNLKLTKNAPISIQVYDTENLEYTVIDGNYIVDPFTISTNLVDNYSNIYTFVDSNDVYIGDSISRGFNYNLSYNIAINATIKYELSISTNNYGSNDKIAEIIETYGSGTIEDKIGNINIDLRDLLVNDYAGQYIINTKITVTQESETYFNYTNMFYLIPDSLYLAISTSNNDVLYNQAFQDINDESIYLLNSGYHTLYIKPYNGNNLTSNVTVSAKLYTPNNPSGSYIISDALIKVRDTYQYPIYLDSESKTEYRIEFTATCNNETFDMSKYIYIKKSANQLKWYDSMPTRLISYKLSEVSTISYTGAALPLEKYNTKYSIDVSSNIKNSISLFDETSFTSNTYTTVINIGIQYNFVNDSNINLITLSNPSNTVTSINIYQDKILLGNNKSIDIYIPKEKQFDKLDPSKYHLITLISRPVSNTKAEFVCYIDGIIENAFIDSFGLGDKSILVSEIGCKLNKGNYSINLFELGYYENITSKITDADIANYYNTYRNKYNKTENDDSIDNQLAVLNVAKKFDTSNEYELVKIDNASDISTIAKNANIPVLILEFNDNFFKNESYDFFTWFLPKYEEEENEGSIVYKEIPVEIYYLDNQEYDSDLKVKYNNNGQTANVPFYIVIQGSSTRHFAIKNLDLTINIPNSSGSYVYSPNFIAPNDSLTENDKKNIFLPEETFTLKADVSDSSHCNNTSIGAFVNDYTAPFEDAREDIDSSYQGYIKNCLLGFPIILILKEINGTDETNAKFYYCGIYNFNLGRKSYFNLGYKPIKRKDLFDDNLNLSTKSEIKIYHVDTDENQLKSSLCIAEIQGNRNEFDFSQFDQSLLFGSNFVTDDKVRMYDDIVYPGDKLDVAHASIANFTKGVSYLGGFIFKFIGKNFGTDEDPTHGYEDGYNAHEAGNINMSINQVPNFQWQFTKTKDSKGNINITEHEKLALDRNNPDLSINDPNFAWNESILSSIKDFYMGKPLDGDENLRNSENRGIDITSLVEYYTICMTFGLVDSVMKNLNIKSWTLGNSIDPTKQDKYYIAFYDMDTGLGRSNKGSSTKYFAFSDYYYTQQTEQNGIITSQDNRVFRDFYPKSTSGENLDGFDVPSSYLFAIAKYQALLNENYYTSITSKLNGTDNITPLAMWSSYRKLGGPLESAEKFVTKYFNKNLKNVPPVLLSYNYRIKYLRKNTDSTVNTLFDDYNLNPLHGIGVHSVEDWLSGRLHILDMYFNVIGIDKSIDKYENGVWSQVTYNNNGLYEINKVTNGPILNTNKDVVILQSIFSSAGYRTYGNGKTIEANVKSQYLAPTIIKGAATAQDKSKSYLFMDESKYMKIQYKVSGNDAIGFNGSVLWTDISELSDFIDINNNLMINSDYLQNIIMTNIEAVCYNLDLANIRSVKSIVIEGESHEFTLSLPQQNLVNLDKIDIHNTKIYISSLQDLNISELNMSNVKLNTEEAKNISILSCNNLTNVNLSGLQCTSLIVSPVWSNNIEIDSIICNRMEFTAKDENSSITIKNCKELEHLKLTGFTSIILENCPKLYDLDISENKDIENYFLKKLTIKKCNTRNVQTTDGQPYSYKPWNLTFKNNIIGNDGLIKNSPHKDQSNNRIFDLRQFTHLEEISFSDENVKNNNEATNGFYAIILPNKPIRLSKYCFNFTPLLYIAHENEISNNYTHEPDNNALVITGAGTFKDTSYKLIYTNKNDVTVCNKLVYDTSEGNISLRNMFYNNNSTNPGQLDTSLYNIIIKSIIYPEKIIDMSYMFFGQSGISYYVSSVNSTNTFESLSKFVNVNNISCIFDKTNVKVFTSSLFNSNSSYIGQNVDSINISKFCAADIIYLEHNIFEKIITKINAIEFNEGTKIKLINIENNEISFDNNIADLFNTDTTPLAIRRLINFDLDNTDGIINFRNLFAHLTNLEEITNSFNNPVLKFTNINNTGLGSLPKLTTIKNSFNLGVSSDNIELINLNTFFNWNVLRNNPSSVDMFKEQIANNLTISFTAKKYIDGISGWYEFWNYILTSPLTILNNIFINCTLYTRDYSNTEYFELKVIENEGDTRISSITTTNSLFESFKVKEDENSTNELPLKLTEDTFRGLEYLTSYKNMFKSCTLYSNLPLNLFRKANVRQVTLSSYGTIDNINNYVEISSNVYDKKLNIYTYNKNEYPKITNLYGMFDSVKIVNQGKTYYEHSTNDIINEIITNNRTNENKIIFNAYKENGDENVYTLPEYYQDMLQLEGNYVGMTFRSSDGNNVYEHYNSPLINSECIDNLFTAPDLLYWCEEGCVFENMFSNSQFEGIMPNHFISKLTNNSNIEYTFNNMFYGVNIIPNKCGSYKFLCPEYSTDTTGTSTFKYVLKTNNIYVFIPEHFNDKITSFKNLFTFNLNIPLNEYNETENTYTSYYVMYSNSIPNASLLEGMPEKINSINGIGSGMRNNVPYSLRTNLLTSNHKIHFNIVLDKQKLENYYNCTDISKYTKDETVNDVTKRVFDFDTIFDYEGFSKQTLNESKTPVNGFNLFNDTNFNKIVNINIAPHLYGYVISPLTINDNTIKIKETNKIITAGSGVGSAEKYADLSCYALFNNNNIKNQLYRTYFMFEKNQNNPITVYDWQGIQYYRNTNTLLLNNTNYNNKDANKELVNLNIILNKIYDNENNPISPIYGYQNNLETVINIPYNEFIIKFDKNTDNTELVLQD